MSQLDALDEAFGGFESDTQAEMNAKQLPGVLALTPHDKKRMRDS